MDKALFCSMCTRYSAHSAYRVSGYTFYECSHCDFVFCPDLEPETVTAMYARGERDVQAGAPEQGWADLSFLAPALHWLDNGRRQLSALDFGAGQSRVPRILRQQGHRVLAVDLVPPKHEEEDRLTGDLTDLQLPANQFDLAYAFQVFEHLPEPRKMLFELLRLVRDQGLVLIHTDMETPERDADGFEHWWYVAPPDHCSFYRHKTFAMALAELPHETYFPDEKTVLIRKRRQFALVP